MLFATWTIETQSTDIATICKKKLWVWIENCCIQRAVHQMGLLLCVYWGGDKWNFNFPHDQFLQKSFHCNKKIFSILWIFVEYLWRQVRLPRHWRKVGTLEIKTFICLSLRGLSRLQKTYAGNLMPPSSALKRFI